MLHNQSILRVLAPFDRDPTTSASYHLHPYHIYKASNNYKEILWIVQNLSFYSMFTLLA